MPQPLAYIPRPCPESWDAMTPTGAGRHCARCQTEVIDFTRLTPAEILDYLAARRGQRVCAVLAAPRVPAPLKHRRGVGRWLLAAAVLLGGRPAAAYSPDFATQKAPSQEAPRAARRLQRRLAANPVLVKGVVLDARTHEPLPAIVVLMKGTKWGTSTDAAGEFELTVAPHGQRIELVVAFPGFKTLLKTIPLEASREKVVILLQEETIRLGRIAAPATFHGSFFARLRGLFRTS